MNKKKFFFTFVICGLLIIYFFLLSNILAAPITIRGTIISGFKILTDEGKIYKIVNSEKNSGLLLCVGKKIEVVGIVEELEGDSSITLSSFKILTDLPSKRSTR
ncbi:MAG TPA: hypothetical protein DCY12_04385 [Candidatus Atribacteria bacterium]|nr:hypothetical protein [Candidatus Atribacteria bacterium]